MIRRRSRWLLLFGAAVVVAAVGLTAIGPAQRLQPSRETFVQVKEGMSREQVIATVGGPPGNYSTEWEIYSENLAPAELWACDEVWLEVTFDREGRAERVRLHDLSPPRTSFLQRVRHWFGL